MYPYRGPYRLPEERCLYGPSYWLALSNFSDRNYFSGTSRRRSLGVLAYELVMGYTPFTNGGTVRNAKFIFSNIIDPSYAFTFSSSVTKDARRLIRQLLKRNPPERVGYQPSAGAHYVKQDPFFDGFDWRGLLQRRLPAPKTPHLTTVADVEAKGHRDLEVSLDEIPDWEPKLAKAGCCGGARVVEEWCDDF